MSQHGVARASRGSRWLPPRASGPVHTQDVEPDANACASGGSGFPPSVPRAPHLSKGVSAGCSQVQLFGATRLASPTRGRAQACRRADLPAVHVWGGGRGGRDHSAPREAPGWPLAARCPAVRIECARERQRTGPWGRRGGTMRRSRGPGGTRLRIWGGGAWESALLHARGTPDPSNPAAALSGIPVFASLAFPTGPLPTHATLRTGA
jgi:hypothetical protein